MFKYFSIIFIGFVNLINAQEKFDTPAHFFEWKTGINYLDTVENFMVWQTLKTTYPNGRKKEELRIYLQENCVINDEGTCEIKHQRQTFYDDASSTLMIKEGKYLSLKGGFGLYKSYYWDFNHEGKLMTKEKTKTKVLGFYKD